MESLFRAIVEDDRASANAVLKTDSGLATRRIDEAKLYASPICHWIYVGDTVLHLAAAGYRIEIARLLLTAGADPNAATNHRQSAPLHYAADGYINDPAWDAKRQVSMIRCLLDAGADVNAQDKNGASPLHRAVRTRCAAAVKCLLETGADPTLKNKPGSTAFHLAVQDTGRGGSGSDDARAAQRQIVEVFLSFGVSTRLKDGKGKSVLDCARNDALRGLLTD